MTAPVPTTDTTPYTLRIIMSIATSSTIAPAAATIHHGGSGCVPVTRSHSSLNVVVVSTSALRSLVRGRIWPQIGHRVAHRLVPFPGERRGGPSKRRPGRPAEDLAGIASEGWG